MAETARAGCYDFPHSQRGLAPVTAALIGSPGEAAGQAVPMSGMQAPADASARLPEALVAVGRVLVRHGLVRVLEQERLARVSVAADAGQARSLLQRHRFDILLVDAALASELGEAALQGRHHRIVLVTPREHAGETPLPGSAQACAMLSEAQDESATIELLRTVARCAEPGYRQESCCRCAARETWRQQELPLSPREREIFLRIGAGIGPRQIAEELGLSVKTVESHREKIKHKLGLGDGDALRAAALRWREGYRLA
ncbi:hypothetical protein CR938_02255 [Pseudoxanthomonas taiwanensis]|uniref:HTH luxR-type domain-containing protein n=2 Tax=Pseudoxanthomonas taiwanensis TaxID=176598 RepID=A0A921P007_9GAMM|nr:hypothetical protein CR938_02255 [Pseudoxanthomonas taiwanensis]